MSIVNKPTTLVVPYGSVEYRAALVLRDRILRKPLGLRFTDAEMAQDKSDYHFVVKHENNVIGCLILTPHDDASIKMRQVAVAEHMQGQGIGKMLVRDAELFALERGFDLMYCNARDTAVVFYEGLGYSKVGEPFVHVKVIHWRMEKQLTPSG